MPESTGSRPTTPSPDGGPARERIDVARDEDVDRWAAKLDATSMQIREAVQAVGDRADEVELHLKGTRSTTNADQEARGERSDRADRPR